MNYLIPFLPNSEQQDPRKRSAFFILLVILFTLLAKSGVLFAQQVSGVTPAGTKFLLYTPPGYNPSATATYPLLVSLHGGSEIGDDLAKISSNTPHQMPPRLIYLNQWPQDLPFIVLSPQLKRDASIPNPNNQEWPATYVDEVITYVKTKYKIDSYKIYLTGISLGGAGCWDYAAAYPTKVTAIVPISGVTKPENACLVKNIPIWAFHGESDALVKAQFSIDMVNAINACLPAGKYKPHLNVLYSRAHEGWNEVYNGTNGYRIYDWLLKFRRNSTVNKLPYVNAGVDRKILLRSTSLHLVGDYFDSDGTIATVKWTQTVGVALTLSNTTSNFLKLTNLKAGVFEFTLTVTDNLGGKSIDKVNLEIVSTATTPAVTSLVLVNGKTNADIGPLTEGQVINKTTLGITEINIRAVAGTGTGSVRFSVNTDQHTRTVNQPGPYLITKQITGPEWQIKNGDYLVCATPYPSTGTRGVPGISQCFKFTITSSATAKINEADSLNVTDSEPIFANESNAIHVYPNPASSILYIQGSNERDDINYTIINSQGIAVQKGKVSNNSIPLSSTLPKGIYSLQFHSNTTHSNVQFIVE